MKNAYALQRVWLISLFSMIVFCHTGVYAQVSLTSTGGTPAGTYLTLSESFAAINAGTHTGTISISIDGNTTEPAAPVILAASGQGAAVYTEIGIKPSVVATISGATSAGSAVINLDGADNVTIDGSITLGGTSRDLTIQNTAANTVGNVACIRFIGRTTLGLGATNISVLNCNLIGNTPGNNGLSGSTVTTSYGIYAAATTATTMSNTGAGSDYDNIIIRNNSILGAYIGVYIVGGTTAQVDNLVVENNTFGNATNRIGFKGFLGQQLVNGNFTNNTVSSIQSTASVNIAGIEVGGTATSNFQIRRNTITDIQMFAPTQYGAYGINVTGGAGNVVSNNVITGVQCVNYASTSTLYNAHGIRVAGGTNHKIYYNSINMYGNYTTPVATYAFSSAFTVTATSITGLDIRNNIFANKMTTNAASGEFLAVYFPASYNFTTTTLDNNAYMVSADASHYVGKVGGTVGSGNQLNINAWKGVSQVGNPTNDVNSIPISGNGNAPYTSDVNLMIPAATVTLVESGGIAIASLGLPNIDRNNVNRPAGTGFNPDMGAYEFEGSQPADVVAPVVASVTVAPGTSCTVVSHTVTAAISDDIGVTSATLTYSYAGVAQTPITMTLASGTSLNGTYTGVIPAAAGPNILVTYNVKAVDAVGNISATVNGTSYSDDYLVVTASPDQLINTNVATTVSATTNDPAFRKFVISEVIQFKTGTGDGTYPAFVPVADNDYVEISNFSSAAANVGGYLLTIVGGVSGTFTIPANTVIPSGATMVLAFSGTASDPTNFYFGMSIAATSSGVACGYILKDAQGVIQDVVATNGYTFLGASGVTAAQWSGNIPSSSGLAGIRRTAAADNNLASDWTVSSGTNLTNIGVYNTEISLLPTPSPITWTTNFDASSSTNNPLSVMPFATPGVYTFYATYFDGTCTKADEVVLNVVAPVTPVANFIGTPLTGSAPLNVSFTDQSTNIPTGWLWTVAPTTGVTFTSGTTNTSQNPVIQFANEGTYTITLTASNSAGSDDSTKLQYVNVNICNSAALNTGDTDIGRVTFGPLSNGSATPVFSNPNAVALYTDFTALPVQTFGLGQTYPISISQITSGATFYGAFANVFIDYNDDGAFDPVTERVYTGSTSATGPISTISGNITIPLTATQGNVRMRVILNEDGTATSPACGTYAYGETEDYIINLQCSTPAPMAMNTAICSGNTTTLTASGNGIQWYATATSPTVLATGSTYTTPTLTSTTSYFASATDAGCLESSRTEFVVTVNQPTAATQTVTSCVDYTWPVNSTLYTVSGMYTEVVTNSLGCDSTITLDLTILNVVTATDVIVSCDSLTWIDGLTYTANNNTAMFTLQTSGGCDSIVTLNLTILNSTSAMVTETACESYTWATNSMTYTASGLYTAMLTNSVGCDSLVTLDLTINAATNSITLETACSNYTWSANGTTYTTSGIYSETLTNAAGCDSIAVLDLTINTVSNVGVTLTDITLSADLASGAGVSYQWLNCDNGNAPIVGATSQTFIPTANGNYAVQVTENGCVDTSACVLVNKIGIDEKALYSVSIVPNPTQDIVTISFDGLSANVSIIDLKGKLLATVTVHSGDQIDLSGYESGVYLFDITSNEKRTIQRIIKN